MLGLQNRPNAAIAHLGTRVFLWLVGTILEAWGIAMTTSSAIGTTPISTVPVTLTAITGYSFGTTTFVMNLFFVAGQFLLIGKKFPLWNLMQIPGVFLFSLFIDLSMAVLAHWVPEPWAAKLVMSLAGNFFLALGIVLQVGSKLLVQPGDGIVLAASVRFGKKFSSMKIANDVSLVIIAVGLGLLFLHEIVGVREGTLISAFAVGMMVKAITAWCHRKGWFLPVKKA